MGYGAKTARVSLISKLSQRYDWAKRQSFTPFERIKYATGIWRDTVRGKNQFAALRKLCGYGPIVEGYVWGGGISPDVERNHLDQLLNPEARPSARERILDRILSGKIKFEHTPPQEVRSKLEKLISDPKLGEKAKLAIAQLPPPLPAAEEAVKVEKVEDSSPVIELIQLSIKISRGENGVLDGKDINQTDLGGICVASGRPKNEDGLLLRSEEGRILIMVADGMGGHTGGEIASNLALTEVDNALALQADSQAFSPKEAFAAADGAIRAEKLTDPKTREMGTTAVAAFIDGNRARIVNVGDTRAFLLRKGNLILLTRDDGSLPGMYEAATKKELKLPLSQKQTKDYFDYSQDKKDTNFDVLYKALGREEDKDMKVQDPIRELKILALEFKEDDMLLLLSDGGYKYFKDFEDFRGVIIANAEKTPDEIGRAVEAAARARMPEFGDNVTVGIYKHRPVSEISDSMIIQAESLSDRDLREALDEESTMIWQRTSTAIHEAQEQMDRLMKTSVFASSEQSGIEKAKDKDEIGRLRDELRTLQGRFVNLKKLLDVFSVKAVERYKEVEAKLEMTKPDIELVALLDLLSGTPEQKKAILESIQIGGIEIPAAKEAGAIEIVSRAWRFDKGLEEDARAVIDFINIRVDEEEGEK